MGCNSCVVVHLVHSDSARALLGQGFTTRPSTLFVNSLTCRDSMNTPDLNKGMRYVCLVYSTLNLDFWSHARVDSQQPLPGLSPCPFEPEIQADLQRFRVRIW